ncbi:Type-F conjugative transfer system pilin assembly protein TrbC [Desulfurispirillum indicum S5]|uniref:Type-F conjugative transfer system pilin assembly protein TrbC n=1 Tax=Desulfurispirillum indicum (strain ATCC BAA-1389 / DSM 22839 / S5) TaxID=653733 RepID=E6W6V7_DESIS|nr:TrbC family F-type conjugative pilus assembly protein [Desulfurispirillum indicum]ADU66200.1 Type-F conjugative transfer system pilin assembly protein TrbC [Desulfurispirillum indicum S5]
MKNILILVLTAVLLSISPVSAGESQAENIEAVAERINNLYFSDEWQSYLQNEQDRLKIEVFGEIIEDYIPQEFPGSRPDTPLSAGDDEPFSPAPGETVLPDGARVLVFISSSMPDHLLRTYLEQADGQPQIQFVMRGFIDGITKIMPTVEFIARLQLKDQNCEPFKEECAMHTNDVSVDPELFSQFDITQVPAMVYLPHVGTHQGLLSELPHAVLHGDPPLSWFIARAQEYDYE